jgi:stage II sporulation protein D
MMHVLPSPALRLAAAVTLPLLATLAHAQDVAPAAAPPIRVKLASLGTPTRVSLRSSVPLRISDPATGKTIEEAGELSLSVVGSQVKAGELQATTLRIEGELLTLRSGKLTRDFPGALLVSASKAGLSLSNECSLERYTEGVLAGECPALFHPEAIRAMAVAARSYSYRKGYLGTGELCDTTHCQVYRGVSGVKPSIHEAVEATAGLCALYDGEVIDAVYSADCGGYTEANENAWKGARPVPYLRAVEDAPEPQGQAFCAVNRSHQWTLSLTKARLQALFGKAERAVKLAILDFSESGRVRRLQLAPDVPSQEMEAMTATAAAGKSSRLFSGDDWRKILGMANLKSLKFEVRECETGVQIAGRGYGHGVGLCQFGANGMGRQGYGYADILQHYYNGVSVAAAPAVDEARARIEQKRMAARKAPRVVAGMGGE